MTGLEVAAKPSIVEITMERFRALSPDLLREHYEDVKRPKPDIDWEAYDRLEQSGATYCLGAFVGEEFVGYSLNFVPPNHLHYAAKRFMHCDLFYVAKSYRGMRHGLTETIGNSMRAQMLREAESRQARLYWRAKPGSPMAFWLERHGCFMEEIVYLEGS